MDLTPEWEGHFKKAIYVIKNTHIIYCDYPILKNLLDPVIHKIVVEYFIKTIQSVISLYGTFEMHFNLKLFTISSAEKSVTIIKMFCKECIRVQKEDDAMESRMTKLTIYNTPNVMNSILAIVLKFADAELRKKTVYIQDKDESATMIANLHK